MQTPKFTQVILKYVKNWLNSKLAKRKYALKLRYREWIEIWKVSSRLFPLLPWYEGLFFSLVSTRKKANTIEQE